MKKKSSPVPKAKKVSPVPKMKKVSKMMTFGEAMKEVVDGKRVTKLEWERIDEYVFLKDGFLCNHHAGQPEDRIHRLMVSEGDLIGKDWMVISNDG